MKRETMIWTGLMVLAGAYLLYRAVGMGAGTVYVERINGTESSATGWEAMAGTAEVSVSQTIGVWVAAMFTLCIFSFIYKDNPFYKIAESVVIGVSAGYWMVVAFWTTLIPNLFGMLFPEWIRSWAMPGRSPVRNDDWFMYFVPLVLGAMLLWRLAPKGAWIARWPLAFIIGTTAGIRLIGYIHADFMSQTGNTIRSLMVLGTDPETGVVVGFDFWASLKAVLLVGGVLCCLVYFFFSVEHKGVAGKVSKVGIWYLMITFGAAFGYTVMGRIALLALRLEFLFDDWLRLIDTRGWRPPDWTGWW
ncbi:MAG: hypothetical protein HQ581_18195 [Planctomycetes bacterium]|nr:hypothetical protein [Planctomycetota bacterium]